MEGVSALDPGFLVRPGAASEGPKTLFPIPLLALPFTPFLCRKGMNGWQRGEDRGNYFFKISSNFSIRPMLPCWMLILR
jgi:hypothetical protein